MIVAGGHAFDHHVDDNRGVTVLTPSGRELVDDIDRFVADLGSPA